MLKNARTRDLSPSVNARRKSKIYVVEKERSRSYPYKIKLLKFTQTRADNKI